MTKNIYLFKEDKTIQMKNTDYLNELQLQELISKHPEIIPIANDGENPHHRWLLISREMGIPDRKFGPIKWSLDILFVDHQGIPTFIEVKRETDSRIHREVIGQMLDYAANGSRYWTIRDIKSAYEKTVIDKGEDPEQYLLHFLDNEFNVQDFWTAVEDNLQNGKIRLIFVADKIPKDLKSIVLFLSENMSPTEVYAVELKQFDAEGHKTIVPSLIGIDEESQQIKSAGIRTPAPHTLWDEEKFFNEYQKRHGNLLAGTARKIYDWSRKNCEGEFTTSMNGSYVPWVTKDGIVHYLFALNVGGRIEIYFYWHAYNPPFDDASNRKELLKRLNRIHGINLSADSINRRPSIPLKSLIEEESLGYFIDAFEWFIDKAKSS